MKKKIVLSVAVVLLVVMIATICVACTPSIDSVKKKFENKEYEVTKPTENSLVAVKKGEGGGLNTVLGAKKITIVWYDDEESAQKAYDAAVALLGEKCAKKKGTAVASGDEDSVKIF